LIGIAFAVASLSKLLGRAKLARVEIGAEPVYASDELEVFVEQPGPATINRITATLKCEERATYTVGTDTKMETNVVYQQELFEEGMVVVARGKPWSQRVRVTMPNGPCSFNATKNEVVWVITLDADIASWPDYKESFEFRVVPRVTVGTSS